MILPLELINYIFYIADNGKELMYDERRREHIIKIDQTHYSLMPVRYLFDNIKFFYTIYPTHVYPYIRETQVCFPPKKIENDNDNVIKTVNSMLTKVEHCFFYNYEVTLITTWNRYFVTERLNNKSFYMTIV